MWRQTLLHPSSESLSSFHFRCRLQVHVQVLVDLPTLKRSLNAHWSTKSRDQGTFKLQVGFSHHTWLWLQSDLQHPPHSVQVQETQESHPIDPMARILPVGNMYLCEIHKGRGRGGFYLVPPLQVMYSSGAMWGIHTGQQPGDHWTTMTLALFTQRITNSLTF